MREFFGIGGYQRTPEGAFSWQHLLFVSSLMVLMVVLAVFLGKQNKKIARSKEYRSDLGSRSH